MTLAIRVRSGILPTPIILAGWFLSVPRRELAGPLDGSCRPGLPYGYEAGEPGLWLVRAMRRGWGYVLQQFRYPFCWPVIFADTGGRTFAWRSPMERDRTW